MFELIDEYNKKLIKNVNEALEIEDYEEASRLLQTLNIDALENAEAELIENSLIFTEDVSEGYVDSYNHQTSTNSIDDYFPISIFAGITNEMVDDSLVVYNYMNSESINDFNKLFNNINNQITKGLLTRKEAIELSTKLYNGPTVRFKNGTNYPAKAYMDMIYRNAQLRIQQQLANNIAKELNTDVFRYSNSSSDNSRDGCISCLGQPVSFGSTSEFIDSSGNKHTVLNLYDFGYGSAGGVQGANCDHSYYPIVRGVSKLPSSSFKDLEIKLD